MHQNEASLEKDEKADFDVTSPSTGTGSDQGFGRDVEAVDSNSHRWSWGVRSIQRFFRNTKIEADGTPPADDRWASITRNLDEAPGGYATLAVFQSSDRNFLQYRGFKYLHSRLLLDLQFDVERLEEELDSLDQYDKENGRERWLQCTKQDRAKTAEGASAAGYPDWIKRTRPVVLRELREKLIEYDELLLKAREMVTLQRPAKRDYESVRSFFRNEGPMPMKEAKFIRRKEDIITLRSGRESASFDGFVEIALNRMHKVLKGYFKCNIIHRFFLTKELRDKTGDEYISYFSPAKIDALVNIIITIVIFILLVLPVIIMYRVTEMGKSQSPLDAIGVLIVFTLIFGMAVSALTTAKRHELFGASAAYAAVLVVFIGNFGVQQVNPGSTEAWTSILTQTSS